TNWSSTSSRTACCWWPTSRPGCGSCPRTPGRCRSGRTSKRSWRCCKAACAPTRGRRASGCATTSRRCRRRRRWDRNTDADPPLPAEGRGSKGAQRTASQGRTAAAQPPVSSATGAARSLVLGGDRHAERGRRLVRRRRHVVDGDDLLLGVRVLPCRQVELDLRLEPLGRLILPLP